VFESVKSYIESLELKEHQSIALSVTNFDKKHHYIFNEDEEFYPASLIKLFAAVLAKEKLPEAQLEEFSQNDIQVAIRNSLEESDNDALSLVYDFISDSSSGIYDKKTFPSFAKSRKAIVKELQSKGFSDSLALHNKCYSYAPYGKDLKLFLKEGSNKALIIDIEKIMLTIINEQADLLESMLREGNCEQSEFIYKGLEGDKIDFFYSKAGWTTSVRHDVAYFSYQGQKYLLVILTKGLSEDKDFIPKLAQSVFA
jgi:hypothetical protein